jgi:hypothetical protein
VVASRLVRHATDEGYRGLAEIEVSYVDGQVASSWTVELGTSGDREWRLQKLDPPIGDRPTLERVIMTSTVWERGERDDWDGRARTTEDRPTHPLFDLTDTAQLEYVGTTDVDGVPLYRFEWKADSTRIRRFASELGAAAEGMRLASGELLATAQGVPVGLDVRLVGEGDRTLRMRVAYSEVGSEVEVRSPRVGPPLVVRSS